MFGMISPSMVAFMAKEKLDEIIKGDIPEGVVQVERTENSITLKPKDVSALEDITINKLSLSITYKGFEFILTNA